VWGFVILSNLGNGEGATLTRVESKRPGMIRKSGVGRRFGGVSGRLSEKLRDAR
jgi:hypothetical protein